MTAESMRAIARLAATAQHHAEAAAINAHQLRNMPPMDNSQNAYRTCKILHTLKLARRELKRAEKRAKKLYDEQLKAEQIAEPEDA